MNRALLKNYSLPELEAWVESRGQRRFRARQLFRHLYARQASSWEQCSDLGKAFRAELETETRLDVMQLIATDTAIDGTAKYLFSLSDGHTIEAVLHSRSAPSYPVPVQPGRLCSRVPILPHRHTRLQTQPGSRGDRGSGLPGSAPIESGCPAYQSGADGNGRTPGQL